MPNLRRSSRLNKLQDKQDIVPRPSRRTRVSSCDNDNSPPVTEMANSIDPADQPRMTLDELLEREKALFSKERECTRMTGEIQERMLSLSRKEDTASSMMSRIEKRDAQATLAQLEEHFTCAL